MKRYVLGIVTCLAAILVIIMVSIASRGSRTASADVPTNTPTATTTPHPPIAFTNGTGFTADGFVLSGGPEHPLYAFVDTNAPGCAPPSVAVSSYTYVPSYPEDPFPYEIAVYTVAWPSPCVDPGESFTLSIADTTYTSAFGIFCICFTNSLTPSPTPTITPTPTFTYTPTRAPNTPAPGATATPTQQSPYRLFFTNDGPAADLADIYVANSSEGVHVEVNPHGCGPPTITVEQLPDVIFHYRNFRGWIDFTEHNSITHLQWPSACVDAGEPLGVGYDVASFELAGC